MNKSLFKLIPREGLVLIAGGIGSGKSCLAYSILEEFHKEQPDRHLFVFNFPHEKTHLLPDYITPTDDEEFPEYSVVLCDEAYFTFYSKEHWSDINKFMDKFSGLVRQKGILAIFVTQTTRKLTLATVSGVQVALFKCPDVMMTKLDRAELRKLHTIALEEFRKLSPGRRMAATYAIALDYEGLIKNSNSTPTFWSEGLSRAWEGVKVGFRAQVVDDIEQGLEDTYREVHRIAYNLWDDAPGIRDALLECGSLLQPFMRDGEDFTHSQLRQLYKLLSPLSDGSGVWAQALSDLKMKVQHLTNLDNDANLLTDSKKGD